MLRTGVDLVRDEQLPEQVLVEGDAFFEHTFTQGEAALARASHNPASFLRGRFAAKEAVFKALDMDADLLKRWSNIEVLAGAFGEPCVRLHGPAKEHAQSCDVTEVSVSITHERDCHLAFCVLLAGGGKDTQ